MQTISYGKNHRRIRSKREKITASFDTGSERSYFKEGSLPEPLACQEIDPFNVGIGGKAHTIKERCSIRSKIKDLGFDFSAHPVADLGKVDEKEVDVLIGSLTMEEWNIKLDPDKRKLDLRGLKKREFTEF